MLRIFGFCFGDSTRTITTVWYRYQVALAFQIVATIQKATNKLMYVTVSGWSVSVACSEWLLSSTQTAHDSLAK